MNDLQTKSGRYVSVTGVLAEIRKGRAATRRSRPEPTHTPGLHSSRAIIRPRIRRDPS